jgi:hypothetical protein
MSSANLEGMFAEFVAQNAPKLTDAFTAYVMQNKEQIGRALAQVMLESLSKGLPNLGPLAFAATAEHAQAPSSSASTRPKSGKSRRFPKSPGSAAERDAKIVAAVEKGGSSTEDIVKKTGLPKDYVRGRLNRMRDMKPPMVTSKGTTSKTRYFRA